MFKLHEIPSFAFVVVIPYLDSQDALTLRLVDLKAKELIDEESALLWSHFLLEDFGVDDYRKTLRVESRNQGPSIFGTTGRNAIIPAESPFQCWKQWKRASSRFFGAASTRNICAPFFLRAAHLWEKIENWCMANGDFGSLLLASLRVGQTHNEWPDVFQNAPGLAAVQALYSFYFGQDREAVIQQPSIGLLGGWSAYSLARVTVLIPPHSSPTSGANAVIATSVLFQGAAVAPFAVNALTGNIENRLRNPCPHSGLDSIFVWLEEYTRRLHQGEYHVGSISTPLGSFSGINQYPNLPPLAGRAVTKGIEVVASSVWSPFEEAFIYSIRMRLLTPSDGGHDPNRDFKTCQLVS